MAKIKVRPDINITPKDLLDFHKDGGFKKEIPKWDAELKPLIGVKLTFTF